jgi:hypothetical protein
MDKWWEGEYRRQMRRLERRMWIRRNTGWLTLVFLSAMVIAVLLIARVW